MNKWIQYLPISDKENAGPRIIIFSLLLLFLSLIIFISNINFLLDKETPFVVNASNFLVWLVISAAFLYTKTEKRMQRITPVILTASTAVLFGGLFVTGGLYSSDTAWAIFIMLVAYLFSGISSGILFTLIILIGFCIYYYGEKAALWSHAGNNLIRDPDYVFSTIGCVTVVLSVLLFAFVKTLNTLQKKNKELTEARFDELVMMLDARSREIETLRNKLAQDFHDQTGSKLVTLKTLASVLKNQSSQLSDDLVDKIDMIEKNARELYLDTRDFIWSINSRNSSLDEIMLHLADFGNSFYDPLDIDFNTNYNAKQLRKYIVPVTHVMQLILLFKEAMTNAGKYGSCKEVVLLCDLTGEGGRIILKDNGRGFNKTSTMRKNGLRNMEERSKELGAKLSIESEEGKGTVVTIIYPIIEKTEETKVLINQ